MSRKFISPCGDGETFPLFSSISQFPSCNAPSSSFRSSSLCRKINNLLHKPTCTMCWHEKLPCCVSTTVCLSMHQYQIIICLLVWMALFLFSFMVKSSLGSSNTLSVISIQFYFVYSLIAFSIASLC